MANQLQDMSNQQKATMTPVLTAEGGAELAWAEAKSKYAATATWDATGAVAVGAIVSNPDGTAVFTPSATGTGTIECTVTYTEPDTGDDKTLVQILEVTVVETFTPAGMTLETTITPQ